MLANRRRRYAIHYLQYHRETVDLGTLAERVGAWEHGTEPDRLSATQRKNTYTALQQRHLPKMDDAGLVSFDRRDGTITPTDTLSEVDIYTEIVPSGDFPWSRYYLGLSVVELSLMTAVWADVFPLTMLSDIQWSVFCVVWVVISAIVHQIMTRRMKLGTEPAPPEVQS